MKTETITMVKLVATEGMILTNGEAYGKEVFLSNADSADNWHEISEEEYNAIQEAELKEVEV